MVLLQRAFKEELLSLFSPDRAVCLSFFSAAASPPPKKKRVARAGLYFKQFPNFSRFKILRSFYRQRISFLHFFKRINTHQNTELIK